MARIKTAPLENSPLSCSMGQRIGRSCIARPEIVLGPQPQPPAPEFPRKTEILSEIVILEYHYRRLLSSAENQDVIRIYSLDEQFGTFERSLGLLKRVQGGVPEHCDTPSETYEVLRKSTDMVWDLLFRVAGNINTLNKVNAYYARMYTQLQP